MAASNIKGITIEIEGSTVGLQNSLKDVNKQSKELSTELSAVERLLKFNPGNVELMAQKQQLLTDRIAATSDKLNQLKSAQSQVQAQFDNGDIGIEQYRAFQRELITTQGSLDGLKNNLSRMAAEQQNVADSTRKLGTLFDATGTSIDNFADALGNDLTNAIRNGTASSGQLEQAIDQIGQASLGTNVDLDRMREALRRLDDGVSIDEIRQDLSQLGNEAQETESAVKSLGGQLAGLAAVAGGTAGALKLALDSSKLDTKINVSFNVPEESKASIREASKSIQALGVDGEEALEGLRRQWALNTDATDESNKKIVEGAAAIAYAYAGVDFVELVQEVNEIGKELKVSDEEALNLVNSLLKIGFPPEQLDIIAEYGNQLQRAGYSAREVQGLFAAGVATGTWNIDNLLDGLKEGRVKAAEMGSGLSAAMKTSLKTATDDGKKLTDEQLSNMKSSMSKQESALSSSLDKRFKATSENYDKQKDHLSKTLDKEFTAISSTYEKQEAALEKSLSKKQDALSDSYDKQKDQLDKALEKEYESVSSTYQKQEAALDKSLTKKTDAIKDSYDKQKDELRNALEKEYEAFEKSTEKKIALIDKEYTEKLKLIDEEKYNQLKAIDSQISRLDSLTAAEEKAAKKRDNANRRAELVATVNSAKTAKDRQTASKNLAEFDERMRLDAKKEQRKGIIDSLKDRKEEINETFSARKDAIKSEQEEAKSQAKVTADEAKKALKAEQEASKKVLDDKIKESLKSLAESNKNELAAFKELNKQKLSVLKEEQSAKKSALNLQAKIEIAALNERVKSEISAFRDVNKQKLDSLKEEHTARKTAFDKRISDELASVRAANQSELASFQEMNQKKMEMAKNPPDSAQYQALEKQLIGWGKAIAQGGEAGSTAMKDMVKWLDSVEDSTVRNALGVGLFGTIWEDQGENIIDTILGADAELKKMEETQTSVNDTLKAMDADATVSMSQAFGKLTEALKPVLDIISNVVVAFANFAAAHPNLVAVIGTVVAVIGMVAGAFMALAPIIYSISTIFPLISTAFAAIMPFVTGLIASLPTLGAVFAALTGPIGWVVLAIAAIIAIVVALVKNWDSVSAFFVKLWDGIVDIFKTAGSAIADFLKENWKTILTVIMGPLGILAKFIYNNWDAIKAATVKIFTAIGTFLKNTWTTIKSTMTTIFNGIKSVITTVWNSIKTFTGTVWNGIKGAIMSVVNGIKTGISTGFSTIKSTVSNTWNAIKDAMLRPLETAKNKILSIITAIKGFFSNFKLKFPKIDMPKLPRFSFEGKFSLNPLTVPKLAVDWYKKGGVFGQASVIGVGEEPGVNEAVIPLKDSVLSKIGDQIANTMKPGDNNSAGTNFGGVVVQQMVVREEADIKKIARELFNMQQQKNRGAGRT